MLKEIDIRDIPEDMHEFLGDPYTILEAKYTYIAIHTDPDPWCPREDGDYHLGRMICFHRKYSLGDEAEREHEKDSTEFYEWMQEHARKKDIVWLPLYLYDHSGVTMHYADTYPYNDYWDSGLVGYIYCTLDDIRANYCIKRVTKEYRERALSVLKGEVEEYDCYLRGDSYAFDQICKTCGDEIDSCAGFLGDDWELNGLTGAVYENARCEYCEHQEISAWRETLAVRE